MNINLLLNDKITKLKLPVKVYGVYPIMDTNGNMLANIEGENGKWVLKSNDYIEITCEGSVTKDVQVLPFYSYSIKELSTNKVIEFIPTPSYDEKTTKLITGKNQIVIGEDGASDIIFNDARLAGKKIILNKTGNHWAIVNEGIKSYVNDRVYRKRNLFHGSYIFVYGLIVIVIKDYFIINNPNGKVKINGASFEQVQPENKNIAYQTGVNDDQQRFDKNEFFYKSPRFRSVVEEQNIQISAAPKEEKDNQTTPAILSVGPRLTTSIMSFYSLYTALQSYLLGETTFQKLIPSIIMIAVMFLSSFFWPMIMNKYQKRVARKQTVLRRKKYLEYLEIKQKEINEAKSLEYQIRVENNLPLSECQSIIYNKKRNLWERNVDDDDFLTVRIGTGLVKSKVIVPELKEEEFSIDDESTLKKNYEEVVKSAEFIENAPMEVSLTDHKIVAIVGNNILTKYFFDSIFLQLITFHSYRELKIFVITNPENEFLWEYMKVLPYCWDNLKTTRYFTTNPEDMNEVASHLETIFKSRLSEDEQLEEDKKVENGTEYTGNNESYKNYETYYLIFIDDLESARDISIIKEILKYRNNIGFSVVIRNNKLSNLPSECKTFIDVEPEESGLFESDITSNNQKKFKAEFNKDIDMYGCAMQLANVPMQVEKAKFELPSSVSFLTMYNVGKVEQLNSLERWKKNNPVTSLAVPVGINQQGELFKMDAHEKGWGPHGLVAGMTGSGKSEWIISYILSLAVNFHPDELQFVLIDYKGGGLALSFENKELGVRLPHLAGTITNLDKSTINRALTSIEAELKNRQAAFNAAREKLHASSMDIYKYQQYYRKGELDTPISHLFIISDEFAELKSQEPEFLDQLVSTARIGRSLGVHLILATQKPSGVVNEQIWSNSRFHVCLRVQDKGDSNEMIKTPDAAMLKTTGAFYLQVGYNEYYALGQSAYSGAKYHPSDIVKKEIDDTVQSIDALGKVTNTFEETIEKTDTEDHGEELLNIVTYISNISKQEKIVGKQLWLPNIPEEIYLNDIKKRYNWKHKKYNLTTVIGEYDNPKLQTQGMLTCDIGKNTAIYGETGSGKENLLTTMIWSSITEHTPEEVNYYIIDFGAETLRMFAKYPHVGEVIFQSEIDKVAGTLQMVVDEIDKRRELFADYNGNYESYLKESKKTLPRWVVIINAWDVFNEVLPKIVPALESLFRDCSKYGVSFICATTTTNLLKGRRAQNFDNFIPLHLPNEFDYRDITGCDKKLIPQNNFGRGIAAIDKVGEDYCEFQTAFVTERENINMLVRKNADNFAKFYKTRAKSLPKIPDNVNSEQLSSYITDINNVPIGYNFYEKDVAKFDFEKEKLFTICFSDLKNLNPLYGLINILSKVPGTKVRVYDLDKIYKGSNLDIQHWDSKLEAVLLALDNDLKKRTLQQDLGITFILGAGLLKTKLNDQGKTILTDYMNDLQKANKSITILVDTYQRMKTLKIEPWFAKINTSFGIWIGSGIDNQNLYNVKDITMEERKLNYEGMAYIINNGDYTLIKTVLDEE